MKFIFAILLLAIAPKLLASEVQLKLGPASVGNGGTNPLGIPPGATDIDITYLTESDLHIAVSVSPGISIGQLFRHGSLFGVLGGGLAISVNGAALALFSAVGWQRSFHEDFSYLIEYRSAIGAGAYIITPYALRMGVGYEF